MSSMPRLNQATSRIGRIVRAVVSGGVTRVLASVITLFSLPLAVRYLGAERYGVWATITTTAVWLNLLDLGIANTLTNKISRAHALNDEPHASRYFTNALALTGVMAGLAGAAGGWLLGALNWTRLLHLSSKVSAAELRHLVAAAFALMLLGVPCGLVNKVLAGYQEVHRSNIAAGAAAVAGLCGLALGVALRVSMATLFVLSAGCLTLANLAMLILIVGCEKPWLRPRLRLIEFRAMRELLSSGLPFLLIQVAAVVVFSSDNLVVSHYLGPAEVTPYSVTWRLVGFTAMLPSLIFPALWPAYAEAHAKGDHAWIRRAFAMTMWGVIAFHLVCAAFLLLAGRGVIRLWAGAAAVPSRSLLAAMCLWMLISGCMTFESCLLAALDRTRAQAGLSIVAAVLNIALSIFWVQRIGAIGVIAGTIVSYLAVLVVPQTLIVRGLWTGELAPESGSPAPHRMLASPPASFGQG